MNKQDRIEEQITRIIENSEDGIHETVAAQFISEFGIDRIERMNIAAVEREFVKWSNRFE